ncbi:hypothetical protein DYBT9275_00533 [Dyadobacter sp. CECT 9275]|uniref:Secretion system C-terminal sorting domain-containing protein n=1 Tax=Dyadobacter helix TaxID=2822344 RepID=A0A916J9M3_9BACT|nr:ice-binding family protein [Dyadobacter sp. CECT 9275]CAG4990459.1 hypothetical protein DYBT9275_00533 [Dyadobacter sp. CECT 9275]
MKNLFLTVFLISFIAFNERVSAQTTPVIDDAVAPFILFTAAGELTNNGNSKVAGDIGTGAGATTGFTDPGVTFTGTSYIPTDAEAIAATEKMQGVYDSFTDITCGVTVLTSPIGNGTILTPGVYCLNGAVALEGNLTLDAGSDPDAVFIFKFGGAFSTGTSSKIILTNNAAADNVYWRFQDAVSLGSQSTFAGTIVAGGAIELLEEATLVGKAFTTAGAITLHNNIITNEETALPVTLTAFDVKPGEGRSALLTWATTAETNSDRFDIQHSLNGYSWKTISSVKSAGESTYLRSYSYTDKDVQSGTNLYRLKMIDTDLTFAYSRIRNIEFDQLAAMVMYPNPVKEKLTLIIDDMKQVERIQLSSITGHLVYDCSKNTASAMSNTIDVSNLAAGIYVGRIARLNGAVEQIKFIKQ